MLGLRSQRKENVCADCLLKLPKYSSKSYFTCTHAHLFLSVCNDIVGGRGGKCLNVDVCIYTCNTFTVFVLFLMSYGCGC